MTSSQPTITDTAGISTFSNKAILSDELPALENLTFEPLSIKYAPTHRLVHLVSTLIIVLIIAAMVHQPWLDLPNGLVIFLTVVLYASATIGLLLTLYVNFADPLKKYVLREEDVSYQSGLFFQKTISQPILRVQHVELKRGPVERKVGLATLQVFSAGGALHTFEIPGLEFELAEHIRQFILEHKDVKQHD
ncbi:PH domain-containing protein [Thalassotalea crassostreae]|uniref:PH domain-containing protein n=1 Tax=Thalassotalea crassostreae TaxID=1763536 RepID=UPI0008391410|nr:PH domain-containing protein [Thalassotalea crassostreae]